MAVQNQPLGNTRERIVSLQLNTCTRHSQTFFIMSATAPVQAAPVVPSPAAHANSDVLHRILAFLQANPQFNNRGLARVALTGFGLGLLCSSFFWLSIFVPWLHQYGAYMVFLSTFHLLEFVMTALFHPHSLTWSCT
jgi:Mg/Co/Ni transporter MgtE